MQIRYYLSCKIAYFCYNFEMNNNPKNQTPPVLKDFDLEE